MARVEVASAFWRKLRSGELRRSQASALAEQFRADLDGTLEEPPRFVIVADALPVLAAAAHLVAIHPLRAYDAVQLASALAVAPDRFACFDSDLREAAAIEGLELVP